MEPIIQYLRRGKKNEKGKHTIPYGCFYAEKKYDFELKMELIYVGWSICNRMDTFTKFEAIEYAKDRIINHLQEGDDVAWMEIPASLEKKFIKFCERAKYRFKCENFANRYFVNKAVPIHVQT